MSEIVPIIKRAVCRVCLELSELTYSLLDKIQFGETCEELHKILNCVSKNSFSPLIFPTRLCQACIIRLLDAYDFISLDQQSKQLLRDFEIYDEEDEHEMEPNTLAELDLEQSAAGPDESEFLVQIQKPMALISTDNSPSIWEDLSGENQEQNINLPCLPLQSNMNMFEDSTHLQEHKNCHIEIVQRKRTVNTESSIRKLAKENVQQLPKHKCVVCPREFTCNDSMRRHMVAFHRLELSRLQQNLVNTVQKKQFECQYCGACLSGSYSLKIHMRRHTGENPYKCEFCKKAFPRQQELVIHRRSHTGERPYECKICGKNFLLLTKLKRHMHTHDGLRPYKCDLCTKTFVQSNDLKIHVRRHTGERPYACNICNKNFTSSGYLSIHRRRLGHMDQYAVRDPYASRRVSQIHAEGIERMRLIHMHGKERDGSIAN